MLPHSCLNEGSEKMFNKNVFINRSSVIINDLLQMICKLYNILGKGLEENIEMVGFMFSSLSSCFCKLCDKWKSNWVRSGDKLFLFLIQGLWSFQMWYLLYWAMQIFTLKQYSRLAQYYQKLVKTFLGWQFYFESCLIH